MSTIETLRQFFGPTAEEDDGKALARDAGLIVRIVREPPPEDPAVVVTVTGDLDTAGAPWLQSAWDRELASSPACVVLDLRRVGFCNAAGLRVLARISTDCRDRDLAMTMSTGGTLSRLLDLVTIDRELRPGRPAGP